MAPDGGRSSNLDHLQRTNISSKQQPPRRKVDSSAPIGAWSLSESQVLTGELGGSDTHRYIDKFLYRYRLYRPTQEL
ncbi:hypothetical protein LINGRAHAP2_LOCUS33677 [Linum grandiflorum]